MVGGVVIEVADVPARPDILFVDCKDRRYKDTCAIYVQRTDASRFIQIGDSIWWQGPWAYWTPADIASHGCLGYKAGREYDIRIPRVGFSGVKYPGRPTGARR